MSTVVTAPRGTKDLLPDETAVWQWVCDTHRQVAESFGYRLMDTPIFEYTELFERGIGTGTDVVDKEMYTFADRSGRSLTLRPEFTAGIVRACMEHKLTQEINPVRVHSVGPAFRYDRPQRGRYRQFAQLDIECLGEKNPAIDAEVVEIGWTFYQRLGIDGVSLHINSLGDSTDRATYREQLLAYYAPLRDQLCADCQRRLSINPLRLLDCKRDRHFVKAAPNILDALSSESSAYFHQVVDVLRDAEIPLEIDPRLVRGLDYYTHTTFEFHHRSMQGAQNALGGGGREDGLAEVLGFASMPGIGYALGVDRIVAVATEAGLGPHKAVASEVVVCSLGPQQARLAIALARTLRAAGIRTIVDTSQRKVDRKLRDADRLGARLCILIGEDEAAAGEVSLRDLRTREQQRVSRGALVGTVRDSLARSH